MLTFTSGNLLDSDAEALVNAVNTVGVARKGIALQFRQAYPANFAAYARACRRGEVVPGKMFVYQDEHSDRKRYIVNFPTKRHWRSRSRQADIEAGWRISSGYWESSRSARWRSPPSAAGTAAWTGMRSSS